MRASASTSSSLTAAGFRSCFPSPTYRYVCLPESAHLPCLLLECLSACLRWSSTATELPKPTEPAPYQIVCGRQLCCARLVRIHHFFAVAAHSLLVVTCLPEANAPELYPSAHAAPL